MIIDFHAHIFPDELAPKAIHTLTSNIDNLYVPVHDGTADGLLKNMNDWNIDISVIQPVITKQSHFKKINEWAAGICSEYSEYSKYSEYSEYSSHAKRIISFGGIFPHTDDYKRDIDFVAGLGLKGLKFHAQYQDFILDDDYMLKIYDYALSKGLIILHHAGFDPAYHPPFNSSPRQFARVAREMRGGIIVAAHLGGHAQWDDVEKYLPGSGIYLDTSMGFEYFPHDQFLRIVKTHGSDKILFGSDSPWSNAKREAEHLKNFLLPENSKISENDIDAILYGNAKRILNLS